MNEDSLIAEPSSSARSGEAYHHHHTFSQNGSQLSSLVQITVEKVEKPRKQRIMAQQPLQQTRGNDQNSNSVIHAASEDKARRLTSPEGWEQLYKWLTESLEAENWARLCSLLIDARPLPVSIELLKTDANKMPKLIKRLSDKCANPQAKKLALDVMNTWKQTAQKSSKRGTSGSSAKSTAPSRPTGGGGRKSSVDANLEKESSSEDDGSNGAGAGGGGGGGPPANGQQAAALPQSVFEKFAPPVTNSPPAGGLKQGPTAAAVTTTAPSASTKLPAAPTGGKPSTAKEKRARTVKVPPTKNRSAGLLEDAVAPAAKKPRPTPAAVRKTPSGGSKDASALDPTAVVLANYPPTSAPAPAPATESTPKPEKKPEKPLVTMKESGDFMKALGDAAASKSPLIRRKKVVRPTTTGTTSAAPPATAAAPSSSSAASPPSSGSAPPPPPPPRRNGSAPAGVGTGENAPAAAAAAGAGTGSGKKRVQFRDTAGCGELVETRHFEVDESERGHPQLGAGGAVDMKHAEMVRERQLLAQMRQHTLPQQKVEQEDLQEWRLLPVERRAELDVEAGRNSRERATEAERQARVLGAVYFDRTTIPDSPGEPDPRTAAGLAAETEGEEAEGLRAATVDIPIEDVCPESDLLVASVKQADSFLFSLSTQSTSRTVGTSTSVSGSFAEYNYDGF